MAADFATKTTVLLVNPSKTAFLEVNWSLGQCTGSVFIYLFFLGGERERIVTDYLNPLVPSNVSCYFLLLND